MISSDHLAKVTSYVAGGARRRRASVDGGGRCSPNAGDYLEPTIVSAVSPRTWRSRARRFSGRSCPCLPLATTEEALRIANNTPYGLSAGVWSANIDTCMAHRARRHAPARSGSTPSWMVTPNCRSAATSNPVSDANSANGPWRTTPRKRQSSFIAARAPVGGSAELGKTRRTSAGRRMQQGR